MPHRPTPATAYAARPKPPPRTDRLADTHDRPRHDKVDKTGCVTLRAAGRLHHSGVGRTHAGTHVLMLVQDHHIRIIHAATGELLRELILDPTKDYQPTGRPPGPAPEGSSPDRRIVDPGHADVLRHHTVGLTGFEPATP
jgi:hypothetical protein